MQAYPAAARAAVRSAAWAACRRGWKSVRTDGSGRVRAKQHDPARQDGGRNRKIRCKAPAAPDSRSVKHRCWKSRRRPVPAEGPDTPCRLRPAHRCMRRCSAASSGSCAPRPTRRDPSGRAYPRRRRKAAACYAQTGARSAPGSGSGNTDRSRPRPDRRRWGRCSTDTRCPSRLKDPQNRPRAGTAPPCPRRARFEGYRPSPRSSSRTRRALAVRRHPWR